MKRRNNNMICIDKAVVVCDDSEVVQAQEDFEVSVVSEETDEVLK